LSDNDYEDVKVSVEEGNPTVIKIHTKVTNDEMVATLSKQTQQYLLDSKAIASTDQIVQQTVT